MGKSRIVVALFGSGIVADRLAVRLRARKDLRLVATEAAGPGAAGTEVPAGTDCIVYLPADGELADGSAAARITGWLRAGCDVVSTAPPEALSGADLIGACRAGGATFHGTGGYPVRLVSRFNRAFAAITRNIRDVELVEERDVAALPADDAQAVAGCYAAGLHTLADAVFLDPLAATPVVSTATRVPANAVARSRVGKAPDAVEQLVVRRTLGEHLSYDSVWSCRAGSEVPLRYRLNAQSSDAIGHVTIEFHAGGGIDPADHLACGALLEAIRPVHESAPGILRHDLGINQVRLNDCLAH